MNRQKIALFVLLMILALAVVRTFYVWPRQKIVAKLKYTPGQQAQPGDARPAVLPSSRSLQDDGRHLRLDLLEHAETAFKGYKRNLFKPVFIDEVKVIKQKAAASKPVLPPPPPLPSVPPPVVSVPVPTPAEIQRRELSNFTFLGFLKKDNHKTIFLARDRDIVLVRKGQSFAGRYQATDITDQALTIRVTDSGDEVVIPLQENRPLNPH